jgi:hypothetical protein
MQSLQKYTHDVGEYFRHASKHRYTYSERTEQGQTHQASKYRRRGDRGNSEHLENSFSFLESYLWAPSSKLIGTFIPTSSTSLCK